MYKMKYTILLIILTLTNCYSTDTIELARDGGIKTVGTVAGTGLPISTCRVVKEFTMWKYLFGNADLGDNEAEDVFYGLDKKSLYTVEEKITGLDMAITLLVGLSSITRSTILISTCQGKEKICYIDEYGYCEEDYCKPCEGDCRCEKCNDDW